MSDVLRELIDKDDFVMPERIASGLDKLTAGLKPRKSSAKSGRIFAGKHLAAAVLAFIILAGSIAGAYSLGYNIPIADQLLSIFNSGQGTSHFNPDKAPMLNIFTGLYNSDPDLKKYVVSQNQAVTNSGITISVDGTIFDESSLTIIMTLKGEDLKNKLSDNDFLQSSETIENMKSFDFDSIFAGKFIDANTCNFILSANVTDAFPDKIKMDLNILLRYRNGMTSDDSWSFHLNMDKSKTAMASKTFTPNTEIDFPSGKAKITRISFTPTKVLMIVKADDTTQPQDLQNSLDLGFQLFDENGRELPLIFKNFSSMRPASTGILEYARVGNIPSSVTVVPFTGSALPNGEQKLMAIPLDDSQGKTLKRSCGSSFTVDQVVRDSNTIKVTFTAELIPPDYELEPTITNSKGDIIDVVNFENFTREGNKIHRAYIFPAPPQGDSYNITPGDSLAYQVHQDESVTIPLIK
ncbi:MAG: DUF4179 domain-containing protein [Bacillota bacterium]|nr:DUF4179 domain-containing protein [Bacillota bacterium]